MCFVEVPPRGGVTVKLNYDLIREILLVVEEISDGTTNFTRGSIGEKYFEHYSEKEFNYHVKYLRDAGFIEPSTGDCVIDITPWGRDYLDSIRNIDIWEKTKEKAKPLGSVAFDVIKDIAKSVILSQLGLK